jgi:23S rRNA pseudouridine955/2504/2580 synthase/23S rRNA pseudouridine1911/1915/1917 synthase
LKNIQIIYEDDDLIFVNKPSGLLVIPDRYQHHRPNLTALLKKQYPTLFTIHRLDKDTSGAIIFAKSKNCHRLMNDLFQKREIKKHYFGLVDGNVTDVQKTIDAPLSTSSKKSVVSKKEGKKAITHYCVKQKFQNISLLDINIETGRTHQIRCHLAYTGNPILCDPIYGNGESIYLSKIKKKYKGSKNEEERPILERTALHAYSLEFVHPSTKEKIKLSAPMPKDMRALVKQLEKWT